MFEWWRIPPSPWVPHGKGRSSMYVHVQPSQNAIVQDVLSLRQRKTFNYFLCLWLWAEKQLRRPHSRDVLVPKCLAMSGRVMQVPLWEDICPINHAHSTRPMPEERISWQSLRGLSGLSGLWSRDQSLRRPPLPFIIRHHTATPAPGSTDLLWGTALSHVSASHPHCFSVSGAAPFLSEELGLVLRSSPSPQSGCSQAASSFQITLGPASSGEQIFWDCLCLRPKKTQPTR